MNLTDMSFSSPGYEILISPSASMIAFSSASDNRSFALSDCFASLNSLHEYLVHQDVYVMLLILLYDDLVPQAMRLSVDPDLVIAFAEKVVEHLIIFTLPADDYRRVNGYLRLVDVHAKDLLGTDGLFRDGLHDRLQYLFFGYAMYQPSTDEAIRLAHASIEDAQVVVYLGDRRHRRARVVRARFLVYGNSRRQSDDLVHVRFDQLVQELSGISRKRFHIASLALGEYSIEGQRRFARAR